MLKRELAGLFVAVTLASAAVVHAEDKNLNLGRLASSAFVCATYAEMSGDSDEQMRLFNVGYNAGKKLLEGIRDKTISGAEIGQQTTVTVLLLLNGPSIDFILGRIYENAAGVAHDSVVKEDSAGTLLIDPSKWVIDRELQERVAQTKYRDQNCELVR